MKNTFLILALALLQLACSREVDLAKASLEDRLATERQDVQYRELQVYPGAIVCGEFSEFEPNEGRTDFKRFIFQAGRSRGATADEWAVFCNKNQIQALSAQLGIGPFGQKGTYLPKIQADLNTLISAIEQYRSRNNTIPPMGSGLSVLAASDEAEKPILTKVPQDPWGRPYIYDSNQLGFGSKSNYKLYTLGADGQPGGRGADADIGRQHLKYLDHMAALQP